MIPQIGTPNNDFGKPSVNHNIENIVIDQEDGFEDYLEERSEQLKKPQPIVRDTTTWWQKGLNYVDQNLGNIGKVVKAVGFTTLALGTVSLAAGFTRFLMAGATLGASLIAATLLSPITASLLMIALISSAVLMGVSVLQTATAEMGKTLGGSQLSTDQIKGRKIEGESNSLSAIALYMGASFNLILNGALDAGISNKQSQIDAAIKGGGNSPAQLTRGQVFEKDVLNELDLAKNSKSVEGGSIPDSMAGGRLTEVKDVKYIYKSSQFRNYLNTGKPVDLIVSPISRVSSPLYDAIIRSGGSILVRTSAGNYIPYIP